MHNKQLLFCGLREVTGNSEEGNTQRPVCGESMATAFTEYSQRSIGTAWDQTLGNPSAAQ